MAINAAVGNPPTNSISFSDIRNEFGESTGSSLGAYRMQNLNIGGLTEVSLDRDKCGILQDRQIPVDNQTISFSDFYNARLNIIIDCHSVDANRVRAKTDRYNQTNPAGNFTIIGPGEKPANTSGKKIIIHVNKKIGSAVSGNVNTCALRTENWTAGTDLRVEVGNNGVIAGAGGNGGEGGGTENRYGKNGGNATSGLGIQYTHAATIVTTEGNGVVKGGGGGGGGGGSAWGKTERRPKPSVSASGGGGGGGSGIPAGVGGARGTGGERDNGASRAGQSGEATQGGEGGTFSNANQGGEGNFTRGGTGGDGGTGTTGGGGGAGGAGGGGEWENGPSARAGGTGGNAGAAIRRAAGVPAPTINATVYGSTTASNVA